MRRYTVGLLHPERAPGRQVATGRAMMFRRTRLLLAAFIASGLAVSASPAYAGPLYFVELDSGGIDLTSSTPLSETFTEHSGFEGTNFYSVTGFASAQPGALHSSSSAVIQLTPVVCNTLCLGIGSVLQSTDSIAGFRLDDVMISGPGTTVATSLNLALEGDLITSAFAQLGTGFSREVDASAGVNIGIRLNTTFFAGTLERNTGADVDTQTVVDNGPFTTGILTGFNGESVTTPTVDLPVGTPFTIVLSLQTQVSASSRNAIVGSRRQADASSLFDHTLSFPVSGPVFNLPIGYTVQSVDGLISDNQWTGGAAPVPVPEPSSSLLLGAGLLCLLRRLWGQKTTRA